MLLPHKNAQKNASIMYKGLAARWKPYEVVRERIWNRCNNLLWRNTEQRMGCFRAYTWYRTENPVLIPSAIFKQSSGSKFGWPSSFASYAKICHNYLLGFVIVFRLKKLRPRGPLWSFEASKFCYEYGCELLRMRDGILYCMPLYLRKIITPRNFLCWKQNNSDGFISAP